jgi:quinol monooxygenase YgiN
MSNLVRVFRANAKPGKEESFQSFFTRDAVSIVRGYEGLVSVQVGLPTDGSPREFLMITKWTSVEALKEFAGERWQEAVIDPEEAPLLDDVHVRHYWEADV